MFSSGAYLTCGRHTKTARLFSHSAEKSCLVPREQQAKHAPGSLFSSALCLTSNRDFFRQTLDWSVAFLKFLPFQFLVWCKPIKSTSMTLYCLWLSRRRSRGRKFAFLDPVSRTVNDFPCWIKSSFFISINFKIWFKIGCFTCYLYNISMFHIHFEFDSHRK